MIFASRHAEPLGIVETAQARTAAAVAGLVARGMDPERAIAKTTGKWGPACVVTAPASTAVWHGWHPFEAHVHVWMAWREQEAARCRARLAAHAPAPRGRDVVALVAATLGADLAIMLSFTRWKVHVGSRHVAMAMCRKWTGASFEAIGEAFARDHTVIIHACNRMAATTDPSALAQLAAADKAIRARWPSRVPMPVWGNAATARAKIQRARQYHARAKT